MNLLVALDAGPEGEELLVSARALSHVSGWPVRVLHVRSSADAPGLELPARLATNTAIQEEVGDPVETILATAHDDDVIAFAMRRAGEQEQYEWSSWHEEFTMRFATCPQGGRHRTIVRVGDPPAVIVEEAARLPADLVVLAWGGVFSAGRSLFVRAVLRDASCPLLLVPVVAHV
jgi:nucleotide-binding universal stress UspA family protein